MVKFRKWSIKVIYYPEHFYLNLYYITWGKQKMRKISFSIIVSMILLTAIFSATISVSAKPTSSEVNNSGATEYYALIIGTDPEVWCDNDANDMYNVLINNGWKSENVKILTRTQATKDNFINEIDRLDDKEDRNDVVLFFFSGHGGFRAIAFYDGEAYNRDAMSLFWLNLYFNRLDAGKLILIFDTCHAGSLKDKEDSLMRSTSNQFLSEDMNSMRMSIEEGEEEYAGLFGLSGLGRIVIASCGIFEYSYGSPEYQNGYFTYHYVEGLKGYADSDNNGRVSAEEAFDYARSRTIDDTRDNPKTKTQHPTMSDRILGQVEITNMVVSNGYIEFNLEFFVSEETLKERETN